MENFNKLRDWLNLSHDNLVILEKGSRGVISKKPIKKGTVIMQIPETYMIEYSNVAKKIKISEKKLNNKNSLMATYFLLESINPKSKLHPYLETMPHNLDEYIYYYDKEKLKLLKDSSIMCKETYNFKQHMENIKEDCKLIYDYLIKIGKLPICYTKFSDFYKLFLRFRILICSRIFGYEKMGADELGLVPYADLLNHSDKPNTTWYFDDSKKAFIVMATKDIPKNREIYDSYGNKTNVQLAMYYGFTIKQNPYSTLNFGHNGVLITLDKDDRLLNLEKGQPQLKNLLQKKLESHMKNIEKTDDENIKNLLLDEIIIIKKLI